MKNLIPRDQTVAAVVVASLMDISVGLAHYRVHGELDFREACAKWVPKRLTHEAKERHEDVF